MTEHEDNNNPEIVFGASDLVEEYDVEIEEILNRMGITSYYVTDESDLGDFVFDFSEMPDVEEFLSMVLKREPSRSDKLWELGKAVRGMHRDG